MSHDVNIHLATSDDAAAVARLAALDSKRLPTGPVLLAEVDGQACAALPLESGPALADPFRPTADLVVLLELRAAQLRDGPGAPRRLGAFARRRLAVVTGPRA